MANKSLNTRQKQVFRVATKPIPPRGQQPVVRGKPDAPQKPGPKPVSRSG